MEKADKLLKLVMEDSSLDNIEISAVNDQISLTRTNAHCRKLTMLARNSASAVKSIISAVHDFAKNPINDFRIFCMLIVLSDAEVREVIDLSRLFAKRDEFSKSKLIAINILLKESMYGRNV